VTAKTAKTRDNYMPRLVFYPKKRSLFTQKRFLTLQNEKCPPLLRGTRAAIIQSTIEQDEQRDLILQRPFIEEGAFSPLLTLQ
jgi:hypothetical protein